MSVPDDMWFYCGVSALVVVIFCCCFHVTELIKLRYLRKLTSADRFSLSGISAECSEGYSRTRTSTQQHTAVHSLNATTAEAHTGNFSIFTVITYTPALLDHKNRFEMKALTTTSSGEVMGCRESRKNLEGFLEEIAASPATRAESVCMPCESMGDCELPPPKYEALFPRL